MRVHENDKDKSYIFRMLDRVTADPSNFKSIAKKLVKHDKINLSDNPLLIVPERVTFVKDDRLFRPFIIIQTEANDYRLISNVTKIWIAIINIDTCDVEHVNEQRI